MTASPADTATRLRNLVLVLVAVILSVAIFLGLRTGSDAATLESLAAKAVPLDIALKSKKPTLMEFYANWCTACQSMAQGISDLEKQYGDRVNFVMLNVDNSKWLPEMTSYRVDGIPHFVFLNDQGEPISSAIGAQPQPIMAGNVAALAEGTALPYGQSRGRISEVRAAAQPKNDDPRGHGGQVVQ